MRPADFPFAVKLANTMDWNMSLEDFELNHSLEPDGCFVLRDDSERVGIATCISFGKVGWFGNLIVSENCRRKSAGSLLVEHAIDYLREKGVLTVGLYAYEHLVGFYGRLGFKPDADFTVLKGKPKVEERQGAPVRITEELVSAVIEFDRACFGGDRSKLLQPVFAEEGNLCYAQKRDDAVEGYVAAKVYEGMAEVGPLVCLKTSPNVALSLLKAVIAGLGNRETFVCVPSAEKVLVKVLAEAGFVNEFTVIRMFLGPAVANDCIYVAESLERG